MNELKLIPMSFSLRIHWKLLPILKTSKKSEWIYVRKVYEEKCMKLVILKIYSLLYTLGKNPNAKKICLRRNKC